MLKLIFLIINRLFINKFLKKVSFFILFFILLLFVNYYFFKENYIFYAYDSEAINILYFEKEDINKWISKYENDPTVNFSRGELDIISYNMNFNQTKNSLGIFHTCNENSLVNRGNSNDFVYPDDKKTVNVLEGRIMYIEDDNFVTKKELKNKASSYIISRKTIDPVFVSTKTDDIINYDKSSMDELKESADCFDIMHDNCLDKYLLKYPKRVQFIVKTYYLNNPVELEHLLKEIETLQNKSSKQFESLNEYTRYLLDSNGHYAYVREHTINNKYYYKMSVCTHGDTNDTKLLKDIKQIAFEPFSGNDKTSYINRSMTVTKNHSITIYKSPPSSRSKSANQLIDLFNESTNIDKINNFNRTQSVGTTLDILYKAIKNIKK